MRNSGNQIVSGYKVQGYIYNLNVRVRLQGVVMVAADPRGVGF